MQPSQEKEKSRKIAHLKPKSAKSSLVKCSSTSFSDSCSATNWKRKHHFC